MVWLPFSSKPVESRGTIAVNLLPRRTPPKLFVSNVTDPASKLTDAAGPSIPEKFENTSVALYMIQSGLVNVNTSEKPFVLDTFAVAVITSVSPAGPSKLTVQVKAGRPSMTLWS